VVGRPELLQDRTRFVLEVATLGTGDGRIRVSGRIRVTVRGQAKDLWPGKRVSLRAPVRPLRNFNNPGGFDYERHMRFRDVLASAFLSGPDAITSPEISPLGGHFLHRFRDRIARVMDTAASEETRGVLAALLLGEKERIPQPLREAFARTGIAHLLAISGLHMGMLATVSFGALCWLLGRSERLLLTGSVKKWAALLSILPVAIYGQLAGMSPATQRAVVMVVVFLCTFLVDREYEALNTLAAAALVLLFLSPGALFDLSFQLSFAAVASVVCGMRLLGGRHPGHKRPSGWKRKVLLFCMVSVCAIVGTLPLAAARFHWVSCIAPLTNPIFVPLVGFGVIPLALSAAAVLPFSETAAWWFMHAADGLLEPTLKGVRFLAGWQFAAVPMPCPSLLETVLYYALIASVLHLRKSTLAVWSLVLVLFLLACDAGYWLHERFGREDLRVTFLDVGQGNAALVELPKGPCMLVDGGGFGGGSTFDAGEHILAPLLWKKKIHTVQTVVLTHPETDHMGGLAYMLRHFHTREFWSNGQSSGSEAYQRLTDALREGKIVQRGVSDLTVSRDVSGVAFQVLYPPEDFLERAKRERWRDANNNSLVLRAVFGAHSFLFAGDLMRRAEGELCARKDPRVLSSTVLAVPHHGSKSSSSEPFVKAVAPLFAVVSAGWNNRFGFPDPGVMERYEALGARVLRTDRHGAIRFRTDGRSLQVTPFLTGHPVRP